MANPKTEHNVTQLFQPEDFSNCPITRILQQSARHLLAQALELEVQQFTHQYEKLLTENGLQQIIRNGYHNERNIQTPEGRPGRQAYPSDMSEDQWQIIEPLLRKRDPRGRRRKIDLRELVNAMFYIERTGCQWRYLPPLGQRYQRPFTVGRKVGSGTKSTIL